MEKGHSEAICGASMTLQGYSSDYTKPECSYGLPRARIIFQPPDKSGFTIAATCV